MTHNFWKSVSDFVEVVSDFDRVISNLDKAVSDFNRVINNSIEVVRRFSKTSNTISNFVERLAQVDINLCLAVIDKEATLHGLDKNDLWILKSPITSKD